MIAADLTPPPCETRPAESAVLTDDERRLRALLETLRDPPEMPR